MIRRAGWLWGLILAAGATAAFPAQGFAQGSNRPERALPALKTDEIVWVTTSDGRVVQGRFSAWNYPVFEWNGPMGLVRMPLEDIQRIEARDPIRDGILRGALIGGGVGGAFGLLLAKGLSCETHCGSGYSRARDIIEGTLAGALIGAGEGAAVGAILDAVIHRRRLVYVKASPSPVAFTSVVGPGRLGAAAIVRW
jgi:hypothetical protein